jgi:hypothetical protein
MIPFKQYLEEGKFRDSPKLIHKLDVPMFSIFLEQRQGDYGDDFTWGDISEAFKMAKKRINKMGLPSMHVNVVFKDYPEDESHVGGKAHGNPEASPKYKKLKSISLSKKFLYGLDNNYNVTMNKLIPTIVHEWSHIWMFNNGKAFRNAIKQYHEALIMSNVDKVKGATSGIERLQQLSDMVNFTGSYGLTDPDEAWATALQKFFQLHSYHRQRILELMQVRGPREIPNSRMQKHLKDK